MLRLYKDNYSEVGPLKKNRKKKDMWCFLAVEIDERFRLNLSGSQVEGRFKTVISKTKTVLQNN